MRIRAEWPLTLQTKVRRVVLDCSVVKVDTPMPLFRNRRILLLDIVGKTGTDSGTDVADGADEPDVGAREKEDIGGSRSTVSANPAPS